MALPRVVSDAEMDEIRRQKAARQPRTLFFEEFAPNRVLQVLIHGDGDWDDDMAEALKNFMARRQHRSVPAVETAHNSGEGLPSSDTAEAGADT
jgi:hypothetical protein